MARMRTLMPDESPPEGTSRRSHEDGHEAAGPGGELVRQPDWLQDLTQPCEEPLIRTDSRCPYVGFASTRSANWETLRQLEPRIKEGIPFVGGADGQFELADPLKYNLAKYRQMWTQRDDQYRVERVEFHDPGRRSDLTEEFLALCVVHLGQRLVPTVSYFAGTKAGAVRPAAEALRKAGSPEWAQLGPAHAASARCRVPFGRFSTRVTIEPRTSRTTARQYLLAVGHVHPAGLEELDTLDQALKDPEFLDQLKAATDVYHDRLRLLEHLAKAGAVA
jgi:hypothetical protein